MAVRNPFLLENTFFTYVSMWSLQLRMFECGIVIHVEGMDLSHKFCRWCVPLGPVDIYLVSVKFLARFTGGSGAFSCEFRFFACLSVVLC